MNENLITLKQAPIIVYEQIKAVGQQIEAKIAELNLDNRLVTDETLKSAKNTRTMLRKELAVFEEQRKFIKEQVNTPYEAFEKAYKEHIKVHYDKADNTLKYKIDEVQNRLLNDKQGRIKDYFTELCQSQCIDFLIFERLPLNITLSDSDKAEMLTEYKQMLDVTRAIQNAQYRKQQREAELQRLEAQKARAEQARLAAEARAKEVAPLQAPEEVPAPAIQEAPAPPQEEIIHVTLELIGTRTQLRALRQFLDINNIKYNSK